MGTLEDMTEWFQQHHTARKFVKGIIVFAVGFAVSEQGAILANLPAWAIVPAGALIIALENYVKHNTTLPIVGAGRK